MQRRNQKVIEETPAANLPVACAPGSTGCRDAFGASRQLSIRRYCGIHSRRVHERILFSGGEYAAAGRARRDRRSDRNRPGGMDGTASGRETCPRSDSFKVEPRGASIQARVYAENPAREFQPSCGTLTDAVFPNPAIARIETWVERGVEVSPFYDPMLAKIIVHAPDRERRWFGCMLRWMRPRLMASKPIWTILSRFSQLGISRWTAHHELPQWLSLPCQYHRCAQPWRANHCTGLSRADWLLECRGATIRSHGRFRIPSGKSTGR